MALRLEGKNALITGAGNGIGREIARRFAAEGARIRLVDLEDAGNTRTAELIRQAGGTCEAIQGDVSMAADVERAFARGPVDLLVNNAAAWRGDGLLHRVSEEDWDHVVAGTLKSVYLCTRAALAGMMERRSGVIVNISSVNAVIGVHLAAYTAAKGGILSLTRLLAMQYGGYGIRVNAISPGTIMTESSRRHYDTRPDQEAEIRALYPAREFGAPADIADAALYLASQEARFVNGTNLVVDGGFTAGYRIASLFGSE